MSSYKHEDTATEERIARILNDAQQQMHAKHSQEKVPFFASELYASNIIC